MSREPAERAEKAVLVAFFDLMGYALQSTRVDDAALAEVVDGYYQRVAARVAASGGRVVKFMGDGALLVWDVAEADRGVQALLDLKPEIDAYLAEQRWECRATAKAHAGPVIAGDFGGVGQRAFDVIGKTVNTAAMLDATGVTLSVEAFRALSPSMRQRFKKHTPPVTYIRLEDPHRFRSRR